MPLQFRQDTENERLASGLVLASGELFYANDSGIWYAGDGTTAGGLPLTDALAGFVIAHGLIRAVTIDTVAAAAGVVTIACGGPHQLETGQDVLIAGATDSPDLNDTHEVTGTPTTTTFTIALAIPNQSATAETGIVHCINARPVDDVVPVFDADAGEWQLRTLTITDVGQISSTTPADGEALIFDEAEEAYVNTAPSFAYGVTIGGVGETDPPDDGELGQLWTPEDAAGLYFCTASGPGATWERLAFASELP